MGDEGSTHQNRLDSPSGVAALSAAYSAMAQRRATCRPNHDKPRLPLCPYTHSAHSAQILIETTNNTPRRSPLSRKQIPRVSSSALPAQATCSLSVSFRSSSLSSFPLPHRSSIHGRDMTPPPPTEATETPRAGPAREKEKKTRSRSGCYTCRRRKVGRFPPFLQWYGG